MKHEMVAGKNAVLEMLRSGRRKILAIYVARANPDPLIKEIGSLAKQRRISVSAVSKEELSRMSGIDKPHGVIAQVEGFSYTPVEEIVATATADPNGAFILVLDGVQDPQNLGALTRTAYLMGAHGIILPKDNAVGVTASTTRASSGATEHIPIAQVTNISRTLEYLKEKNIWVVGAEGDCRSTIYTHDFKGNHAVVMGGEDRGVRDLVKRHCDVLVSIPMPKGSDTVGSYNVSVAGALLMGEILRSRTQKA